ncbi:hypothetical protein Tco_1077093 [Tanacetum coccineum]
MLKVAKLFQESEQSLILSFEKVNIDDGADKSLSRTSHAEEIKATTDATQSLGASESAEDQVNQPQIADAEKVLDQNIQKEVKESGLESMGDVTFEQIMDEYDQKNKPADDDAQITFLGSEPYMEIDQTLKKADSDETDSGLQSIPNDDLASFISKKVADDIQSSVPSIIVDALKANLPGLLSEALQNTLSQMIKDSIPQSVQESIEEKFPVFDAQDRRTMFKDMVSLLEVAEVIKKANAEGEKWEKNNPKTPIEDNDAQNSNQTQGEQHLRDATMANAQGEQPPAQELSNVEQAPLDNEENVLVLHAFVEKSSERPRIGDVEVVLGVSLPRQDLRPKDDHVASL